MAEVVRNFILPICPSVQNVNPSFCRGRVTVYIHERAEFSLWVHQKGTARSSTALMVYLFLLRDANSILCLLPLLTLYN